MRHSSIVRLLPAVLSLATAWAGQLDVPALEKELTAITHGFNGRVGGCVQVGKDMACVRADERFPLQSVMKLPVGLAALDAVDNHRLRLEDTVDIHKQDLSVYVQPLADLVGPSGYRATIGDLIRRAIVDSDNAAADNLLGRLGGPTAVQSVLQRKGISGIRLDRDERHLQTEFLGLTWRPEYVDAAVLKRATAAVPESRRKRAVAEYQADPRDTSTPRGMTAFLVDLAQGRLLSASSTAYILRAMHDCATGQDRLKAGVAPGWQLAHKTGTSGSWSGLVPATNDVGILTAPDGTQVSIAVFVADSRASSDARAAIIAKVSAVAIAHYH